MGDSAGGHLTSLAALAGHAAYASGRSDILQPPIRAVASIYGVHDLLSQWEHDQIARPRDHVTEPLMGFSALEDRWRTSGIPMPTQCQSAARRVLDRLGTADDVADPEQSTRFVKELKQSGQFVRTVPIVGRRISGSINL